LTGTSDNFSPFRILVSKSVSKVSTSSANLDLFFSGESVTIKLDAGTTAWFCILVFGLGLEVVPELV